MGKGTRKWREPIKLSLAVFDMLCYNKMNYADNRIRYCAYFG